jgi:glycosyltransferase involved in cell wall biosynthesis
MDPDRQQTSHPRVLVIVPAYNEERRIRVALDDLRTQAPWADVVVVDDGSVDATAQVARQCGVEVLSLPINLGVGGAMQTGYLYARQEGYDIAVQFDGDGQHRANQIESLIEPLLDRRAEIVIGSRLTGKRQYRFSPLRWIGSRLLVGLMRLVTGKHISDPTSGFRAVSREVIDFFARYYPENYLGDTVEALVLSARHGARVTEVPARMRMTDESSITSAAGVMHTFRICLAVLIDCMEARLPTDLTPKGEQDA